MRPVEPPSSDSALHSWRKLRAAGALDSADIAHLHRAWSLFVDLDDRPERSEALAFLLSEPEPPAAPPDWMPVIVSSLLQLPVNAFFDRAIRSVRSYIAENIPDARLTLTQRLAVAVTGGELGPEGAAAHIRLALHRNLLAAQILLDTTAWGNRYELYSTQSRYMLPGFVEGELASAEPSAERLLLALMISSVFCPETLDSLLAAIRRALPAQTSPTAPEAALERAVQAHGRLTAKRPVRPEPPLKIAVCISGQMRGINHLSTSWRHFGFHEHDTKFFVHTWKRLGSRPPGGGHAFRLFEPRFAAAFIEAESRLGLTGLRDRYPALMESLQIQGEVDEVELRGSFQATDVCVEDESDARFVGKSNTWKMHYKIRQAHKMAREAGEDFDLYVRIRPDLGVLSAAHIDWRQILTRCQTERLIYADVGRNFFNSLGYIMGDQFAVGAAEGMDALAGTFDFVESLRQEPIFSVPLDHSPHSSPAHATFFSGVKVEKFPNTRFDNVRSALFLSCEVVQNLLQQDIGAEPDDIDTLLLSACRL